MNTKCYKNEKRWWIFRWLGTHQVRPTYLSVFGQRSWAAWNVNAECTLCGCHFFMLGVDESDLIARGIVPKVGLIAITANADR